VWSETHKSVAVFGLGLDAEDLRDRVDGHVGCRGDRRTDDIRALFKEEFSLEEKAEKERAIKETKKSIILTMLKNGLSPEEISNMTDLPIDLIKEVQGK
jgi:hypothetical protein